MKKILSCLIAVLIIASISVSAFAAVTMSPYVFRSVEDDGNTYVYHFGTRDNTEEEVGIEIDGEKYSAKNFDIATNTKFGIGIADPANKLGDSYTVLPYAGETYGTPVIVDKNVTENVVINVADSDTYSAEPYFGTATSYTARKATDDPEDTDSFTNRDSEAGMNVVFVKATQDDTGYQVPFMQFNIPENLEEITNGRKAYLNVTLYGGNQILNDYYIDLYGVEKEGTHSIDNIPVRDEINGAIDTVLIPAVEKFTTNDAKSRIRIRFDITNYLKKRIYENSETVTFSFKTRGIEYEGSGDGYSTTLYTNNRSNINSSYAFDPVAEIIYAPSITFDGQFNVETPSEGFAKAQIKVTDYAARQQSNKYYRTSSVANTVQLISSNSNVDNNVQTGYMQLTMPESFEGVEPGTKIELNFYAYTKTTTNNLPARIYAFGTTNEYDATKRPTANSTQWSEDFPLRNRDALLGSFDIASTATAAAPQLCTLDITKYVLSKMASGEDTATLSFKVEYQDNSTATGLIWAQIFAHDTTTAYAPYVQYRQGENTFVSDGSDLPSKISFKNVYRNPGLWTTSDNKKLESTDTLDITKHVLSFISGTTNGANENSMYNSTHNASYKTYIIQPYNMIFDISSITAVGGLPEGKKVYLNFAVKPRDTAMNLIVDGVTGAATSVKFTNPDATTDTRNVFKPDAITNVASFAFTSDDLNTIQFVSVDVTDYINQRAKAGYNDAQLIAYPDINGAYTSWLAYPRASESFGTEDASLTIE